MPGCRLGICLLIMPLVQTVEVALIDASSACVLADQVLDVCSLVKPQYWELKEVALYLASPNALDPSLALGLYVKSAASDWQYRGCGKQYKLIKCPEISYTCVPFARPACWLMLTV